MAVTKALARAMTLREITLPYGPEMVHVLARVAMDDEAPHAARVSAANHLLNRAYGQPAQAAPGDADGSDNAVHETDVKKLAGLSDAALEEIARAEARANA